MRREEDLNARLGKKLMAANPLWKKSIKIEETQMIEGAAGKRIDILLASRSSPIVAIETSYVKGDADADAIGRLGCVYKATREVINTAIAIELDKGHRSKRLDSRTAFKYALHQRTAEDERYRFPTEGFMVGTYNDIARLMASTAIPKEEVERIAIGVGDGINAVHTILGAGIPEGDLEAITDDLNQRSTLPALKTTAILWLNSYMVQQMLRGTMHLLPEMTGEPDKCADAWKGIQKINWNSIFSPAIGILERTRQIRPDSVRESLEILKNEAQRINSAKLGKDINIGAELFPIISADRETSAAFYTQAPVAEFLAAMTITPDMAEKWDKDVFKRFKIADMACGTGTLLRFGYRQVRIYHEQAPKSNEKTLEILHRDAMERGLIGVDISPIAAHLTSSSLAMVSKAPYRSTNIGWIDVGNPDLTGSIEYIDKAQISLLTVDVAGRSSGTEEGGEDTDSVVIKDGSIDVCLLNPPYSRTRRNQKAFDIRGMSDDEKDACQRRWGVLTKKEPCNNQAGMAATFLCIAKKKVKRGGKIGFVLPMTASAADTWTVTRDMIEREFEDIIAVVVMSGKASGKTAMSKDTKMEEMLLVAKRKAADDGNRSPVRCVVLDEPIIRGGIAAEIARAVLRGHVEGPLMIGDTQIGVSHLFNTDGGRPWSPLGIAHDGFNDIMVGLSEGRIVNADGSVMTNIKMSTIGSVLTVGSSHHSIGHLHGGDPIGGFTMHKLSGKADVPGKHRALWSVNSKTQTTMVVPPTHKGVTFRSEKAKEMWNARTTLFISRGARWTSQRLMMAMTSEAAMGGSSWTGLSHDDERVLKAFALWGNSIYGLVTMLEFGQRTHSGRSRFQVRAIKKIPCPKLDELEEEALNKAADEFDRLSGKTLNITNLADDDQKRDEINAAVSEMLGIPGYDTKALTEMWCAEPAVNPKRGNGGNDDADTDGDDE